MISVRTRRLLSALSASALILMPLAGCSSDETADYESADGSQEPSYESSASAEMTAGAQDTPYQLGSAGYLSGTTVLVSIFVSDADYQWDFSNPQDQQTAQDALNYMSIGTAFLRDSAARYGRDASFVYDWNANRDLAFEAFFSDQSLVSGDTYYEPVDAYVRETISSDQLKQEYGAANIIYVAFFNTPDSLDRASNAMGVFSEGDYGMDEMLGIYTHCLGQEESPGVYAHELLHCFGAPDLYADAGDQDYGLNADLRNAYKAEYPQDIMIGDGVDPATDMPVYDRVPTEITDLTAYYTGLTDESPFKDQYQLADSQYVQLEG